MYYSIEEMLEMIEAPNRKALVRLYKENEKLFKTVQSSTHNHQAWKGGYWDHVQEVMNLAVDDHMSLDSKRNLPFTLGSALTVLSLHDIEKPWAFELAVNGELRRKKGFDTKADAHNFRLRKLKEYGIKLSPEQENAIKYVEGEHNDYTNKRRVMNELAAFCHRQDSWSARGWHDHPLKTGETWGSRQCKKEK